MRAAPSVRPAGASNECRPPAASAITVRRAEEGYNLVILMVLITVTNIMVAVALPSWSKWAQREKEEELIFRGLQYAEAIRVFQTRFGRPPNTLEELIEVEPRSIRQLYPNPMTENGKWGILVQAPPTGGRSAGRNPADPQRLDATQQRAPGAQPQETTQPRAQGSGGPGLIGRSGRGGNQGQGRPGGGRTQVVPIPPTDEEEGFGRPSQRTTGPIVGVYAGVSGEAIKVFFGQTSYEAWHFTTDLLPMPVMVGGDAPAPRVTAAWVGKPFREDLQPQGGAAPGASRGRELGGSPVELPDSFGDRGRRR